MALSLIRLPKSVGFKVLGWTTPTLLAKSVGVVHPNTFAQHLECTFFFPKLAATSPQLTKTTSKIKYFAWTNMFFFESFDHSPELEDDSAIAVASEGVVVADVVGF